MRVSSSGSRAILAARAGYPFLAKALSIKTAGIIKKAINGSEFLCDIMEAAEGLVEFPEYLILRSSLEPVHP